MPSYYLPKPRALLSRPPAPRNLPQSPRQLICAGAGALRRRKWSHSVARTPHLGVAMGSSEGGGVVSLPLMFVLCDRLTSTWPRLSLPRLELDSRMCLYRHGSPGLLARIM